MTVPSTVVRKFKNPLTVTVGRTAGDGADPSEARASISSDSVLKLEEESVDEEEEKMSSTLFSRMRG